MSSLKKLWALGPLLLLASLLSARAELQPGDALPPLGTLHLAGTIPPTAGKVVLIDFWASWCAPCKESFPALSKVQNAYQAQGLQVIGVSVDENPAAYARFLQRLGPSFATVLDGQQQLVRLVKVPAMPTSYLFGRDGKLHFVHVGFHGEKTEAEIRQHIELLLNEKG